MGLTAHEILAGRADYVRRAVQRKVAAADVEDVVQDVFVRVVTQVARGAEIRDVKRWLSQVVLGAVADHHDKRHRTSAASSLDASSEDRLAETLSQLVVSPSQRPAAAVERQEIRHAVRSLLVRLEPSDQLLLELHYNQDLRPVDIARRAHEDPALRDRLGLPEGVSADAVRKRIDRLKAELLDGCLELSALRMG